MKLFKLLLPDIKKAKPKTKPAGKKSSTTWEEKLKQVKDLENTMRPPLFRKAFGLSIIMMLSYITTQAQLSGYVFRDYNGNGIQGKTFPNMEPGVAEVAVCAFDSTDNLLHVTLTDDNGFYSMTAAEVPSGVSTRLEFIIQTPGSTCYNDRTYDYSSSGAQTYGSAIQFVKGGATNVNFALNYPGDFTLDNNPYIYMSKFVTGNPLGGGTAGTTSAFVAVRKNFSGTPASQGGASSDEPINIARADSIGSVWGAAYSRQSRKIFASAFVKRHAGLGPLGSGGVYLIDPSAVYPATTTRFFNLDGLGFPTHAASGSLQVRTNAQRGLSADANDPSHDSLAYFQVGKTGIGGMDVSADGQFLFMVNLYDNNLYKIDLRNPSSPLIPTAAQVSAVAVPDPGCNLGVARAFAVKYFRNKVYVGVICTGENGGSNNTSGAPTDLYAYVYSFDVAADAFDATPAVDGIALNFHKGRTNDEINPNDTLWNPWSDDWHPDGGGEITYPQPIVSDIEFDNDGSIILAFMDRMGHQGGSGQYNLNTASFDFYSTSAGGDLIRVYKNGCSYEVENNGTAGPITTSGSNNYQGIGGGEFYHGEFFQDPIFPINPLWFDETSLGSVSMLPGDSSVTLGAFSVAQSFNAGGLLRLSNTTGERINEFQIFDATIAGNFGNANGIGKIRAASEKPDIEIGNLVWREKIKNGIADAHESGIDNVIVELVRSSDGVVIGKDTTDNKGRYYFNMTNVTLNGANGLLPNVSYKLRIASSQFNNTGTGVLSNLELTTQSAVGNGEAGMSDNDASLVGARAEIEFATGAEGVHNHNLDFGFKETQVCTLSVSMNSVNISCNGGNDGTATASVTNNTGSLTYLWSNSQTNATAAGLAAGTYTVTATDVDGCTISSQATISEPSSLSLTCSAGDVSVNGGSNGTASVAVAGGTPGYTYLWSNNATTANVNALTAGTYTVTVTDANGCSKECSSVVNEPQPLSITLTANDVECNGGLNGSIINTVTGGLTPYTYLWENGATTKNRSNLAAGTYTVTVTDDGGASISDQIAVIEPAALVANCSAVNVTINGGSNGIATVSVSGGTSPYSYLWTNGNTSSSNTGLVSGTYTVTVTDANGCATSCQSTVNEPNVLTATINEVLGVSCNGSATGELEATATGGLSPYTYAWSNGTTSAINSNLIAGIYTVIVTDDAGASASTSYTLSEPVALTANCSSTNVTINGASDGTAEVTAAGGVTPYTYLWSNGQTTANVSGLNAIAYTVTVTDGNGCEATCNVFIAQPMPLNVTILKSNISCFNGSNGTMDVVVSGGVPAYQFLWNDGNTDQNRTGLSAGTYTVTVTDANGATKTKATSLTEPTELIVNCSSTNITVFGSDNGTASVSASGSVGPYSFLWSNGETAASISGLAANSYTVVVSDDNGCTASCSVAVSEPTALEVNVAGTDVTCFGLNNGSIDVTASGGVSPYAYLWNNGDTNEDRSNLDGGTYTVTVTDANGASVIQVISILEPAKLTNTCSHTNVSINGLADGSACVVPAGGTTPYTYLWTNGETTDCINNLTAGTYTATVTDANGCTKTCSQTVTQPAALDLTSVISPVSCNGLNDGSINVSISGGVLPYSFLWDDGTTTADRNGLVAGTYTITVTDANGAVSSLTNAVIEPALLTTACTSTDVTIFGINNGTATSSPNDGTAPYTYSWSNGATTQSVTNLAPGNYSVVVTDANLCSATCSVSISEPNQLAILLVGTDISCNGLTDGAINGTTSGGIAPYTYVWQDGNTNEDRVLIGAGTYQVTVTDANGATVFESVVINEPIAINSQCVHTDVSINGGSNGSACVFANGGTAPFTYLWDNGNTNQCINNLTAGIYYVTITDASGCTTSCFSLVDQPDALSASASITNVTCNGLSDGAIEITTTGGGSPYTYLWDNGSTSEDRTNLSAGSYTVVVTDKHGATFELVSTVIQPDQVAATCTGNNVSINGADNGSASVTGSGGVSPYAYLWSTGAATPSIGNLAPGTYTVTVTDANGCSASCNLLITEPGVLSVTGTTVSNLCNGDANGSIDVTVSGGTAPYQYTWENGSTDEDRNGLTAGTYTVVVVDANGAIESYSATLTDPDALSSTCSSADITINGNTDGTASVAVAGGTSPYTYLWSNGATTSAIYGLAVNSYAVTVTDANGCNTSCSVSIIQPDVLLVALTGNNILCYGNNTGTILNDITGGVQPYSVVWNDGSNDEDRTGLYAGTYIVTVTDANGASATASIEITEPDALNLTCQHFDVSVANAGDGSACVLVNGGTGAYSYVWSNGESTQCINSLSGGVYSVIVTDDNGCTATCNSIVFEPGLFSISAIATDITCNGLNNGSIDITTISSNPPVTYLWSDASTNEDHTGLAAGVYTVTATDGTGDTRTSSVVISEPSILQVTMSGTDVTSNGGNDGTASVLASGGSGNYTYIWSNAETTNAISNLSAGTYTVTVTDLNNCTVEDFVVIAEPMVLAVSLSSTNISCNGLSDGLAEAVVTGGVSPYAYTWSNGSVAAQIGSLSAATYTVIVTDANGVSVTDAVTITEPAILSANCFSTNSSSNGANNGSALVVGAGGTLPYTYAWSNGESSSSISNLGPNIYTVIITDDNGCTTTCEATVLEPGALLITEVITPNACAGGNTATIDVTIAGGVAPYSYLWDNGDTSEDRTGLSAGTYTLTVTDDNGISNIRNIDIVDPADVVAGCTSTDVTTNGGIDGTASVTTSGGQAPYSYLWSNGETTAAITGLIAGTYTVTATDASGCASSCSTTIYEPGVLVVTCSSTNCTAFGSNDGSASVIVNGGVTPYQYLWSNGVTSSSISNLGPNVYTVIITDNNGYTATCEATVLEPGALLITEVITPNACAGGNTAAIDVTVAGGVAPYSYLWDNGDTSEDRTGLSAGTYTLTVTDDNGISNIRNIDIVDPADVVAGCTSTDVTTNGGIDGTASVTASGGQAPYSYLWSNGETTAAITGLIAGTYTVTATDASGCASSCSTTIYEPGVLVVTCSSANCTAFGSNDGSASVIVNGGVTPYQYLWSNGEATSSINTLVAGSYTVTVTDANGISQTCNVTITQPDQLLVTLTPTNETCYLCDDGSITSQVLGGVPPYSYLWSNGATTANIANLQAGVYTVTVTDASGGSLSLASVTAQTIVTQPAQLVVNCMSTNVTTNGGSNGTVSVIAVGGVPSYTYLWSNGATTSSLSGLIAGTYTVTVTGLNGESVTCQSVVSEPGVLYVSISTTAVSCYNGADGSLTANVTGAQGNVSYIWSNGATDATIFNATANTYTVIVLDGNGNSANATATLSNPSELIVSCSSTDVTSCNAADGSVSVSAIGGTGNVSYLWSNGATTMAQSNLSAGTYTVTVTDGNGCESTCSVDINGVSLGSCTIKKTHSITCHNGSNGALTVNIAGLNNSNGLTYLWSTGGTTATVSGLSAGFYTVTVTNQAGCSTTCSVCLVNPALLVCNTTATGTLCGTCNGSASVIVTGGITPYTYLWSNGDTSNSIAGLCAGNYTVTVTDKRGCSSECNVKVDDLSGSLACSIAKDKLIICFGDNSGALSATATGGSQPYTYLWSNGFTTASVTSLYSGTYTVTVTDANGCNSQCSIFLGQPAILTCNANATNETCGQCNGTASVSVNGGVAPYTYQWSNGASATTATGLCAGNYDVIVTDARGCSTVCTVKVDNINEQLIANITKDKTISCFGGNDGELTASATGGTAPYTYLWSNGQTNATITGLGAGAYTVTVTSALGCFDTISVCLFNPDQLVCATTANSATCNACNGSATATVTGGKAPYTFLWSNGATTAAINNLCAGNYSVTVTDKKGCTSACTVKVDMISDETKVSILKKQGISCNGASDGELTASPAGGTAPYTYLWSNGSTNITIFGLSSGTYSVTVTSAIGCQAYAQYTLTQPSKLVCNTLTTESTCGACNGTASVTASGGKSPYTFLWNNGQTSSAITGLCAGMYTVTVTDSKGCTTICNATVTDNMEIVVCNINLVTPVMCSGTNTAVCEVQATGGSAPYTYLWSNGYTTATVSGLAAGTYTVTVTSAYGCTSQCMIKIDNPAPLIAGISKKNAVCFQCNGVAQANPAGGVAPYSYSWTNGKTTKVITGLCGGTFHTVTITDVNGCTTMATVYIDDEKPICGNFMSGFKQNYYNPNPDDPNGAMLADYLDVHFADVFPNGMVLGGPCNNNTITLTSAAAVKTFLPSKGWTHILNQTVVNPLPGDLDNGLASQLVALSLNINFDLADPGFAPMSNVMFKDLIVDSGAYKGYTVEQVYTEASRLLSGCTGLITRSEMRNLLAAINSSWSLGTKRHNLLVCPKFNCNDVTKVDVKANDFLQLNAYPNPSSGVINIEFIDSDEHDVTVDIYDLNGKLVYETTQRSMAGSNLLKLDLTHLSKAVYMLKLQVNFDIRVKRVILQ
ncbi:MAG: T9SS type A sorting domain-containing protein [Bacteroidetes bacterium]|nr:T9SS type A sorting domain-containing protein [Bacteroidota bacterium]